MYYFVAVYTNMDTLEERELQIQIESQFCESERIVYIIAMEKAYDNRKENESLDKVEFIAC
jgi:hypothetical protein